MKKIIQLLFVGIIMFSVSCDKDKDKDEINPLMLLALLPGNATLTVKATFTGTLSVDSATKKMYVYLYRSLGTTTRDPVPAYTGSTDAAILSGVENTITIANITPGNYYVLVFYDFKYGAGNIDNKGDKYILYNGANLPASAIPYSITGNATLSGINVVDTPTLGDNSAYQ